VGASHVLICIGTGNLFGWGSNHLGQIGPGLPEFVSEPVETDSSRRVIAVAASENASASILQVL
jgi:alpha-tubulin suppressor-like RCC1 family protein